jgi:hypothetical protein
MTTPIYFPRRGCGRIRWLKTPHLNKLLHNSRANCMIAGLNDRTGPQASAVAALVIEAI